MSELPIGTRLNAWSIARKAHDGQFRVGGEPHIGHVERVAEACREYGEELEIVAFLHDVLEDSSITWMDLIKRGIPAELVAHVETLSRREGEPYEDFIDRCNQHPLTRLVKIMDINDNLKDAHEHKPHHVARYQTALKALGSKR